MQQLSALDAAFVYTEGKNSPQHIGSIAIYDPSTSPNGKIRFKDVLAYFQSRLGCAKAFRQKLVRVPLDLDHPYWIEDAEFDLEYHVRHIALPAPGDWRQLCIQTARIHARPLDMTKPLWEYWIVEGLDTIEGVPPGSWAIVSKVHHAAIDGASGMEMTAALHDLDPDAPPRVIHDDWKPEEVPSAGELLAKAHLNSLTQPWRIGEMIANALPGLSELRKKVTAGEISLENAGTCPNTRFNRNLSPHRVVDGITMPMAEVKMIRQAVSGATVNDVLLSIVGGGLRNYLEAKGELPDKSLTTTCPISVRSDADKGSAGNQVAAMIVKLSTDVADPLERLRRIVADSKNSKAMVGAIGAKNIAQSSELMPGALVGLASRLSSQIFASDSAVPASNCIVTNVPGPMTPLFFCGARMIRMHGTGPLTHGMGLINIINSYCGEVALSFTSDRDMMPDPAEYAAALRQSADELLAAAKVGDPTSATPEVQTRQDQVGQETQGK
ncbi:WS/DGAT/MGAT family O-acyltransferase [Novosphingobium sp. B 225]|uniref:WS/DGAT/MGAT family O-acyltransferase n=1 Tax=Novosphingobium sp. B 225 TaxID=1961849 RepID=UPI0015960A83|nr:wax ester/triacylglycerol synthase family O-acyltransferase [Novosphingobium sp. B 225]